MHNVIEKINKHIPSYIRKNIVAAGFLVFFYKILIRFDKSFKVQMSDAIRMYNGSDAITARLYNDILTEFVTSWVRPSEYIRFGFFGKTRDIRDSYIADYEEILLFKRTKGNNILPDSKYDRYLMFQQYFHREVLCVASQSIINGSEYNRFIYGKDSIVIKPLKGTKGHGVAIVDTINIPSFEEFLRLYPSDCIIEETINQGMELKQFHPPSVNTVRFVTGIDFDGEFHYLFSLIRIGHGGRIIDNVAGGGLVALIDIESGEICTPAYAGTDSYEVHPDTKSKFQGFKIPQWNNLCNLVKTMHLHYPEQRVFGFDMAWTVNGWDLVEVNPAPSFSSYQQLVGVGARPYLKRINLIK